MAPFHTDQLTSFSVGGASGSPMEEVLALQSYSLVTSGVADFCVSDQSKVVICDSAQSGRADLMGA